MRFFHDERSCRHSPTFPHCNCGAAAAQARLELLEQERAAIERLAEGAETVLASDIVSVLAGGKL